MKIKTARSTYEIIQGLPEGPDWRPHLAMVSSIPNRFVGLVDGSGDRADSGPFTVYGALLYIGELGFEQVLEVDKETGQPRLVNGKPVSRGLRAEARLRTLIPYDLLAPATVRIHHAEHILWADEQEKTFQDWIYSSYLNVLDPPRVIR